MYFRSPEESALLADRRRRQSLFFQLFFGLSRMTWRIANYPIETDISAVGLTVFSAGPAGHSLQAGGGEQRVERRCVALKWSPLPVSSFMRKNINPAQYREVEHRLD